MLLNKKGVEMRYLVLMILGLIALVMVILIFYYGMDWFVENLVGIFMDVNNTRPDIVGPK